MTRKKFNRHTGCRKDRYSMWLLVSHWALQCMSKASSYFLRRYQKISDYLSQMFSIYKVRETALSFPRSISDPHMTTIDPNPTIFERNHSLRLLSY